MFLGKEVRVFLKGDARSSYIAPQTRADKEAIGVLSSFARMKSILKENPQFGDPLRKQLIPRRFSAMGITNLYRAELFRYWRMLYTVEGTRAEILIFILFLGNHKEYDKLFGYRKR